MKPTDEKSVGLFSFTRVWTAGETPLRAKGPGPAPFIASNANTIGHFASPAAPELIEDVILSSWRGGVSFSTLSASNLDDASESATVSSLEGLILSMQKRYRKKISPSSARLCMDLHNRDTRTTVRYSHA